MRDGWVTLLCQLINDYLYKTGLHCVYRVHDRHATHRHQDDADVMSYYFPGGLKFRCLKHLLKRVRDLETQTLALYG